MVSIALLILLFSLLVDVNDVWTAIMAARPDGIALAIALIILALLVSAIKWGILLRAQVATISLPYLFNTYLVGLFFNNFLPSNVGGDVARIADIAKRTGKAPEATASVIGERLISGLALALTALIGLLFSPQVSGQFRTDCWRTDSVLCIRDGTIRVPESEEDYQYGDSPAAWSQMVRKDQPGRGVYRLGYTQSFHVLVGHVLVFCVPYHTGVGELCDIHRPEHQPTSHLFRSIRADYRRHPTRAGFGQWIWRSRGRLRLLLWYGRRKQFRRGRSLTTLWDTGHAG